MGKFDRIIRQEVDLPREQKARDDARRRAEEAKKAAEKKDKQ
jgi:hypothetical protein